MLLHAAACCGMLQHASKPPPTGPKIRCCGMLRHSAACCGMLQLLVPAQELAGAWGEEIGGIRTKLREVGGWIAGNSCLFVQSHKVPVRTS